MKTGYTKEARLILQSGIYVFCYTTKLELKKTISQTDNQKKQTNKQTENYEITVCWNRHKYCKVQHV